ncbi:MAG: hemerythrin domain-containing protein [Steroidobacteraceae bacterium]
MSNVVEFLGADHRRCDAEFALAEAAAAEEDMPRCAALFQSFRAAVLRHFRMEEELLFPEFEAATGSSAGPTAMMRHEHLMMRELLDTLQRCAEARDSAGYLGAADTLMVLMQQHNMKEEGILYPMCDQMLAGQWEALRQRLQDLPAD